VPPGLVGELHVGGAGVARGYLNRAELTAERFVVDRRAGPPAVYYRSGDLVRVRADGDLEYLGRGDRQVKLRGHRIETGEVETVLRGHPGVADAVVRVRDVAPDDRRLVAWVVPTGSAAGTDDLRSVAAARLPAYMVPSAFVTIAALPLTANGKLDEAALPAPTAEGGGPRRGTPARTALELRLAGLFEDLLGVAPVGIDESFFALGGHSLLAVRLMEALERLTGRRVSPVTLFENPTVAGLAAALTKAGDDRATAPMARVQPGGARRPFGFLHGDLTNGGVYALAFARALGADVPVDVFHPHGTYGLPALHSIEAMAADHVRTLRAVQPHGPYRLGGFCGGGLVAFEMARQLHAAGERVEFLALVDAAVRPWPRRLVRRLVAGWGAWRRLDEAACVALHTLVREHLDYWRERVQVLAGSAAERRALAQRTWRRVRALGRGRSMSATTGAPAAAAPPAAPASPDAALIAAHGWHIAAYAPGRYPGWLTVIRAAGFRHARADLGWRRLAAGVDLEVIPGRHDQIFDGERMDLVARAVRARIEALDRV
jgi:thioesterase domain-containing protein